MQDGPPDDDAVGKLDKRTENRTGWGTFDQLIDHGNPALGTFKQRYWYSTEFWKGPGSPVYLINTGEADGTGLNRTWLTTARLSGRFANSTGGAIVLIEHRYWGESSPFQNLTIQNLRYLTLNNSLKDMTYFAKTFVPPFDTTGKSSASVAPWVMVGGSYSAALAIWIAALEPGTFWAYYGASATVEAIGNFWQYYADVQEVAPRNCSADLNAISNHVDELHSSGSPKQRQDLQDKFMLGDLTYADFAATLAWGPNLWQSTQFNNIENLGFNPFHQFCDYIENVWPNSTNPVPGPGGVGLTKALDGYAKYFKERGLPGFCESSGYPEWAGRYNTLCLQAQNASSLLYTDHAVDNWANRQWAWMKCNEPFEYWQVGGGGSPDRPTVIPRLIDADYYRELCSLYFPPEEGGSSVDKGKRADDVNRWTGGWDVRSTKRAMFTNGQYDPWRGATLSSRSRPGGPAVSTPERPVRMVVNGTHSSELYHFNWETNEEVRKLVLDVVENMKEWVGEFYEERGATKPWE